MQAAGPLAKWAESQIAYANILLKVKPLELELTELEKSSQVTRDQLTSMEKTIATLEVSIGKLKEEYAVMISETQTIKTEMTRVKDKVERATNLLDGLSGERNRWEQSSEGFRAQMSTLVADVMLGSAFLTYIGFFDERKRASLVAQWQDYLSRCKIPFKKDLALREYLSSPDERVTWKAHGLPADDLCVENAIVLKRFNRYPLVIDPSDQAVSYLMAQFADKKIARTSFLDDSFMKNLESALRFGYPLLVQDVENIDPILNPVLNKEVFKTGGRTLIR
jgi:dynein heavy chain 1